MIRTGDIAPDFTLPSHDGDEVRLHDVLEQHAAVVFFYARDATPG